MVRGVPENSAGGMAISNKIGPPKGAYIYMPITCP